MTDLFTPYGERLDPDRPLPEYPRPQMARNSFLCLNGRWRYAVTTQPGRPPQADGEIIVPFSPESLLSGVGRVVKPDEFLWYFRHFSLPLGFNVGRVLLHFGAVDQCCTVYVNGQKAGRHDGGYLPFSLDITPLLQAGENELCAEVIDETDTAPYARGRQRIRPGGLWHTPQSGIWQTVWLESVPQNYIRNLTITPLYDEHAVEITIDGSEETLAGQVEVFAHKTLAAKGDFAAGEPLRLALPGAISWSPEHPFLYTVRVRAGQDLVAAYFGMRKITVEQSGSGPPRIFLNNRPRLLRGVFDQGMYSDGLYTPPADAAMKADIDYAKACGFNMIRKHGKIEPMRWYYHCDLAGVLVWQDLPAGGAVVKEPRRRRAGLRDDQYRHFGRDNAEGRETFLRDMQRGARIFHNTPSLIGWTLFHDGWGQFDAAKLAALMKQADPGRLVDHASGRFDQGGGDVCSLHSAGALVPLPENAGGDGRAVLLSAFGGLGLIEPGHFAGDMPHSAGLLPGRRQFGDALGVLWQELAPFLRQGLAGYIYVQLADVQDEVSGLLSFDRRVQKVPPRMLALLNGGAQ